MSHQTGSRAITPSPAHEVTATGGAHAVTSNEHSASRVRRGVAAIEQRSLAQYEKDRERNKRTESERAEPGESALRRRRRLSEKVTDGPISSSIANIEVRATSSSRHRSAEAGKPDSATSFTRLSRISEDKVAADASSPTSRNTQSTRTGRRRHADAAVNRSSGPRHIRKRYAVQPRLPYNQLNASVLSILSTLSGMTDRSSGSNSTMTQASYDKQKGVSRSVRQANSLSVQARHLPESTSQKATTTTIEQPHPRRTVLQAHISEEEEESDSSSDQSDDEDDSDDSDNPATPSSRSTFPSPADVREDSKSMSSQRRNSVASTASSHHSAANSGRSTTGGRYGASTAAQDDSSSLAETGTSRASRHDAGSASLASQRDGPDPQIATTSLPRTALASHHPATSVSDMQDSPQIYVPSVKDASGTLRVRLSGYDLLAKTLADPVASGVKPLYRKFSHLNHRVLLHLQDELSEYEEQLRILDEQIAQTTPLDPESSTPLPASRRGEAYAGTELHHRRRHLLGYIFMKLDQYNKAVASFSLAEKEAGVCTPDDIDNYKLFLRVWQPIHPIETQFLDHTKDLAMVPPTRQTTPPAETARPEEDTDTASSPQSTPRLTDLFAAMSVEFALSVLIILGVTILRFTGHKQLGFIFAAGAPFVSRMWHHIVALLQGRATSYRDVGVDLLSNGVSFALAAVVMIWYL